MFFSPIDAAIWTALGVVATLICALVAQRLGVLQINLMRQAHTLNIVKATPRIGCSVVVDERQVLPQAYRPHLFIVVKLYNEGDLPAEKISGQWKFLPPDIAKNRVFDMQRDFLGKCEDYTQTYKIDDSSNHSRDRIAF